MRILLALGANARAGAAAVAALAGEHEVVVTHDADLAASHALELELRNRLPDKDVVSVLPQVVVDPEAPWKPRAIAEVRSLRLLLEAGTLLICAGAASLPVAVDEAGALRGIEAAVDMESVAPLLARRLDADHLFSLGDAERLLASHSLRSPGEP